ncbi:Fe2+-dependent dioxygenase [Sulfuriferula nivalis]|uniref:PKHD-type hydroxylase n=1 Tax=Sulfuriferula nivalis TaxID=2675298 RepID=A0A809S9J5_9PROT|nr:Fe2+-dependent dioxygenase [Sulfuriferula nivalis]BBP01303.1 PKHD-type hydroxylase [Sulfuriferula nivalis]
MLITIDDVLTQEELTEVRNLLANSSWDSGHTTAGTQAAKSKNNQQLAETAQHLDKLRLLVLGALNRNALFFTAALPQRILPPLFNRYSGGTNFYGNHVDNAMRRLPDGSYMRSDVSATLFLADPDSYDGGELMIEDTYGSQKIKLQAGSMVIYPASSVHQVLPVTHGERLACFMWIQSMVRNTEQRRMLFEMDMALLDLRHTHGDTDPVIRLTSSYHNLLRTWAET